MNLSLSGHHLLITPAIRDYVTVKLDRVTRHFDKLRQQVTANLHIRGKDIHAECVDPDMYAAIDALADKLDRQVLRHKEKKNGQRHEPAAIKRTATAPVPGKARPH
jgi:putative sigma-54 modulation protein